MKVCRDLKLTVVFWMLSLTEVYRDLKLRDRHVRLSIHELAQINRRRTWNFKYRK